VGDAKMRGYRLDMNQGKTRRNILISKKGSCVEDVVSDDLLLVILFFSSE
jgi:hypothetical protein